MSYRIAVLKPASGGFGEYQYTESRELESEVDFNLYEFSTLEEVATDYARATGGELDEEVSGRIHRQNGGLVIRYGEDDRDGKHYELIWEAA